MRELSPIELRKYLADTEQGPLLLDVREPWEFQLCHLDGSQSIPMGQVPAALDTLKHERETVVICHHGVRSRQIADFLEQQGFSNVINLTGGVAAWAQDVDPEMATY